MLLGSASVVLRRPRACSILLHSALSACLLIASASASMANVSAPRLAPENVFVDKTLLARTIERHGASAGARVEAWLDLMRRNREAQELVKLRRVNDFFNAVRYVDDQEHWGKSDYWATPLEFLSTGAGDCEDYSIAKYITLRQLGVPAEKLKITFVTTPRRGRSHMVLSYYPAPDADPLILDNVVGEILPHSQRPELSPIYSFNANGVWMREASGRDVWVGSARQVGGWRGVMRRMQRAQDI